MDAGSAAQTGPQQTLRLRAWLDQQGSDYGALRSALGAPIRVWYWRHAVYWLLGYLLCTIILVADQVGLDIGAYGLLYRLTGSYAVPYLSTALHLLAELLFVGFWISLASFAASRLEILRSTAPEIDYSRLRQPLLLMLLLSGWPLLVISAGGPLLGSLTGHAMVSVQQQMPSLIHSGLGKELFESVYYPLQHYLLVAVLLCTYALLMRHSWMLLWVPKLGEAAMAPFLFWLTNRIAAAKISILPGPAALLLEIPVMLAPLPAALLLRRWQPAGFPRVLSHPMVLLSVFDLLANLCFMFVVYDASGAAAGLADYPRWIWALRSWLLPLLCYLMLAPLPSRSMPQALPGRP